MPHVLPRLPYGYDGLEPTIDELTMRLHHGQHHATIVDELNAALATTTHAGLGITELIDRLREMPGDEWADLRHWACAHYNHSLFWESMSPSGGTGPGGSLRSAIDLQFGSTKALKRALESTTAARLGLGWIWLVLHDGELAVASSFGEASPLLQSITPIFGIDVWEHAYYLKYRNRRLDYVEAWWNLVNWQLVNERYETALRPAH